MACVFGYPESTYAGMFYFSPLLQVWISHLRSIGYEVVTRYVPIEFTVNGPGTEYAKCRRHWIHIFPHGYTYYFFPTIVLKLRTNISVSLNSISICHICFLGELNSSPLQSECLIVLCGDLNVLYGGLRIRLYRIILDLAIGPSRIVHAIHECRY